MSSSPMPLTSNRAAKSWPRLIELVEVKYFNAHSIGNASATNQPAPKPLIPSSTLCRTGTLPSTQRCMAGTTFAISHSSGPV